MKTYINPFSYNLNSAKSKGDLTGSVSGDNLPNCFFQFPFFESVFVLIIS